jgi:hypothetical protein
MVWHSLCLNHVAHFSLVSARPSRLSRAMSYNQVSWLDEGQTMKEILEFARQMLQTRRIPYLSDWDLTDELVEALQIPMVRVSR